MAVNSANARIFGSDSDAIWLAPIGTALPTSLTASLDGAFEDVGWIHSDGITEAFSGSKEEVRGHQGAKVVRTRIATPGTEVSFLALESKVQTKALRYYEKASATAAGVRTVTRSPSQRVSARAAVVDIFDADDVTIKERWVFPRLEITPDGDRVFVNSDIAGFPFMAEVIGDYTVYEGSPIAAKTVWNATINGTPTGGTFTLIVNGFATAPIAYNANAASVQAALNAMAGVSGQSGVVVTGTNPLTVTFLTAAVLTGTHALTGGTSPSITVA